MGTDMRAADPDNNTRSGASSSSTPPLHAEVRAAVAKEINSYFGDQLNLANDGFLVNRVIQAVADALLAGLPAKKHRVTDNIGNAQIDSYNAGHNNCLDAVTRVIGELGGGSDAKNAALRSASSKGK